ncbi:ParB/RepB/Spo0J family partition protein [Bacilliculturomica massiliensis]|uniref:ParB/RepB/Spo0J family partition protein n=1 Tax=Bacilliculturomica massiliensis TaxID=1917867 RepID=UPI00102F599A|nr:ParB/RepB/Spo0J family partition protein [Bacilliculturomica massiliensis]
MFGFKKSPQLELPIESIHTNPDQPRRVFDKSDLEELCCSIREFGVIQPLIVKRDSEGRYILIAGERRLRASAMAGLTRVPVVIREADDKDTALIALVENVQRADLNYIEEAAAYKSLMEDYGLTQSEIARRMGKQQSTISNKIRLLVLPVDIQLILAKHQLSERHARALLRIEDNELRKSVLNKIIDHNLNVKQTEKLIEDVLVRKEEEARKSEKLRFINYKIYLNTLKKAFSTISDVEKDAEYYQEDKGDFLEVRIVIPKKEARRRIAQ